MDDAKRKRITEALAKIDKKLGGKGNVIQGDKSEYEVLPTGLIDFDMLGTTIGGYPKSRIVEQFSKPSCGKTTLFLMAVAECQKKGGVCAWVDAEHAMDKIWAKKLGVNIDELYITKPDTAEDAFNIIESLIDSNSFDFIVVDSVSRLTPRAEQEGDFSDSHMGLQARLLSQMCRKLVGKVAKSKCCLAFINQIRQTMNTGYGAKTAVSGGLALSFYSSIRIELSMIKTLGETGKEPYGNIIKAKFVKNKCGIPFREVELLNIFGRGFSKEKSLLDMAIKYSLIDKAGSWFSMGDKRLGQGEANILNLLENDKDLYKKLYEEIIKKFNEEKLNSNEIIEKDEVLEEVLNEENVE